MPALGTAAVPIEASTAWRSVAAQPTRPWSGVIENSLAMKSAWLLARSYAAERSLRAQLGDRRFPERFGIRGELLDFLAPRRGQGERGGAFGDAFNRVPGRTQDNVRELHRVYPQLEVELAGDTTIRLTF